MCRKCCACWACGRIMILYQKYATWWHSLLGISYLNTGGKHEAHWLRRPLDISTHEGRENGEISLTRIEFPPVHSMQLTAKFQGEWDIIMVSNVTQQEKDEEREAWSTSQIIRYICSSTTWSHTHLFQLTLNFIKQWTCTFLASSDE